MHLAWQPPKDDGGSPVFNYVLQLRKESDADWSKATDVTIEMTSHKLTGLQENMFYEFRVAAENKAGLGPYSLPSTPVQIKEPGSKPEVLDHLNDVTVTSPEAAVLSCGVNLGEHKAKVTWYQNGKELTDSRADMTVKDGRVTLTLADTKVKDTADYKVVVDNKLSKVDSKCKLNVLCKFMLFWLMCC